MATLWGIMEGTVVTSCLPQEGMQVNGHTKCKGGWKGWYSLSRGSGMGLQIADLFSTPVKLWSQAWVLISILVVKYP